jgi:vacuolar-type H+-ATPase subunit I/STV1
MEAPLKELAKLERLTTNGGKPPSIPDALESLLLSLQEVKDRISEVAVDEVALRNLVREVESRKKEVDERQKEVYSSVARLGKALDKVSPLFRWGSVLTSMNRNS